MRVVYVLLSPTFGMHQYTADLANRMADDPNVEVHLVTTSNLPRDRYSPAVRIHTPMITHGTGFALEGLNVTGLRRIVRTIDEIASAPIAHRSVAAACVHFTGVHAWNVWLVATLRRRGIPVIHTLHDLDPHMGVRFGSLIRLWNRMIVRSANHLLVHGQLYRERLLAMGVEPQRVTATPLLHLFLSYARIASIQALTTADISYEPWALFFGRLERYKGVATLLQAGISLGQNSNQTAQIVLAGPGALGSLWDEPLPPGVELRQRLIDDDEAIDLFRRCGLVVLPYLDATQSALVAAAYFFGKPVLVTRTGALPEYVQPGQTGWVVEPGDSSALAQCLAEALPDARRLARMGEAGRAWYQDQRRSECEMLQAMTQAAAQADGGTCDE